MDGLASRAEQNKTANAISSQKYAVLSLCLDVNSSLQCLGLGGWLEEGRDGHEYPAWWGSDG